MDIVQLLPKDIYDAAIGSASPSASNVFATMADVAGVASLYSADGVIAANRIVTVANKTLTFDFSNAPNSGSIVWSATFGYTFTHNLEAFTIQKNGSLFTSDSSGLGIRYAADYSGTFVARSLVDKDYVDTGLALYLPLTGGTMTGTIISSAIQALQVPTEGWIGLNGATDTIGLWHTASGNVLQIYNGTASGKVELSADSVDFNLGSAVHNLTASLLTLDASAEIAFANSSFLGKLSSSVLSGNKTWTFPDTTGTVALTSDFATGATYTPTNVGFDRSYDADSTTINELADVVGTLIADLQGVNILL